MEDVTFVISFVIYILFFILNLVSLIRVIKNIELKGKNILIDQVNLLFIINWISHFFYFERIILIFNQIFKLQNHLFI